DAETHGAGQQGQGHHRVLARPGRLAASRRGAPPGRRRHHRQAVRRHEPRPRRQARARACAGDAARPQYDGGVSLFLSNLVDTLWSQFKLETDEHFELIEPLLSEPEGKTRDGIAQLFRSFHSVKGLTRAVDLAGLEAIAHRAENLLGLVREDATPFDIPVADTLLLALDTLRRLRDLAVETRQDQPPPIQLLAILDRLCFERAQEPAPASGGESAAPEAPAAALGEDAEMLHLFGELLAEHAPNLALVAPERVAARAAEIAESAAALAHAAEVMGFELLVENLQQLAAIVSEDAERIDRIVAIGLLADIVTQIGLVREVTGAGFDTTTFSRVLVG